jgi:fused signal recognition particle receptor
MAEFLKKWRDGLSRTRDIAFGKISTFFGNTQINTQTWDALEALLIQADMGFEVTETVLSTCKQKVKNEGFTQFSQLSQYLQDTLVDQFEEINEPVFTDTPSVIVLVGVNGSGKTTTAAKLAYRYAKQGKNPLLIAADTFRAAAIEQLEAWSKRLGIPLIAGQQDGDPGAVVFDGIRSGISRGSDIIIIDTAGRLHTRFNLMEEIKKVYKVCQKALPGSPQAVWLVLDATTGQNAMPQALAFKDAVNLTGIILAKLDSTAKGGMAFAINSSLGLPILYAGLGEKMDDLELFNRVSFVQGIMSE